MTPTAPDRALLLAAAGLLVCPECRHRLNPRYWWNTDPRRLHCARCRDFRLPAPAADVPDWALADAAAEAGLGDAETIRRGLALDRAVGLLVELEAHDGRERCAECDRPLTLRWSDARPGDWCEACHARRRPGPTPRGLAAAVGAALDDAGDVRAGAVRADERVPEDTVLRLCVVLSCPACGWAYTSDTRADVACRCGWSGPASALLPPLLSRDELERRAAALRATRG